MRYIIGFLVTIGLLVLLIFLLVGGGNKSDVPSEVPKTSKVLQEYANTDASVRVLIDGPVNAQQEHQQTRITVSRDAATLDIISGYGNNVTYTQSYPNTREAFVAFLRSLDRAGFTKGDTSKDLRDWRGYCPLGKRYVFDLIQNGETIQSFWTTNCRGAETYLGDLSTTLRLFKMQIPEFASQVNRADGIL